MISAQPVHQNRVGDQIRFDPSAVHDPVQIERVVQSASPAVAVNQSIVGDHIGIEPFQLHLLQELLRFASVLLAEAQRMDEYIERVRVGEDSDPPHLPIDIPAVAKAVGPHQRV